MKTVRCKFKCVNAEKSGDVYQANFEAVFGDDHPENKEFFKYTPAGQLNLGVVTEQHFEVDKFYYLDITEAS